MTRKEENAKADILFIEDDWILSELYKERLQMEGFNVQCAHRGDEGLRKVFLFMPKLVILDLMLPKVSGQEILKEIKNNPKTKEIPVIILTALPEIEKTRKADFVFKKADNHPKDLVSAVKNILGEG